MRTRFKKVDGLENRSGTFLPRRGPAPKAAKAFQTTS